MTSGNDYFTITIRKRAGWFWAIAALWLLSEGLLVQTAMASVEEGEYRAATICWIAVTVLLGFGCIAWVRRGRPHNRIESDTQNQEASTSEPTVNSTVA